jgi:hypothetical protein
VIGLLVPLTVAAGRVRRRVLLHPGDRRGQRVGRHRALAFTAQPAPYLVGTSEIADIVSTATPAKPGRHIHDQVTALGAPPLHLARSAAHGTRKIPALIGTRAHGATQTNDHAA